MSGTIAIPLYCSFASTHGQLSDPSCPPASAHAGDSQTLYLRELGITDLYDPSLPPISFSWAISPVSD